MQGAAVVLGGNGYSLGTNTIAFFSQPQAAATADTIVSASDARMVIANNGNVGIGDNIPDEKLRVNGNIKAAGDFIGSAIQLGFAGTANITTYDSNEDLLINPNGSGDVLM